MTLVAARALTFEPAGDEGIARIVIDRPDDRVNAVNVEFVDNLADAIREARAAEPRGLILASAKKEQWVAGADLKQVDHAGDAAAR